MKGLGVILIAVGMLWFIFELVSPGFLPRVAGSQALAVVALGAGILLLWLGELARQRRQWRGLANRRKTYYD